jgi:hypothetical protein
MVGDAMVGSDHGLLDEGSRLKVEYDPNPPQAMRLESNGMLCDFVSRTRSACGNAPTGSGARELWNVLLIVSFA